MTKDMLSGAVRTLAKGVKLAIEEPPGQVSTLPIMTTSRCLPSLFLKDPSASGLGRARLILGGAPEGLKMALANPI